MNVEMSLKNSIAVVLRFANIEGVIRERFIDLVHIRDTSASFDSPEHNYCHPS